MATLKYVGKAIDDPNSIAYKSYRDTVAQSVLTEANIDSSINSAIAPYTTKAYVDQQDALRASKSYVDQQDATKAKLAARGQASGLVPLDSSGLVPTAHLTIPGAYQHNGLFGLTGTASSYSAITSTSTFRQLGYIDIPAGSMMQNQSWWPMVFGHWECIATNQSGATPYVEVRLAGTSGTIVARGVGANSWDYHSCKIMPYGPTRFVPVNVTQRLYFYGRMFGSGSVQFTGVSNPLTAFGNGCAFALAM